MIDSNEHYSIEGYAGNAPKISAKTNDDIEVSGSSTSSFSQDFVSRNMGSPAEFAFISLSQLKYVECESSVLLAKASSLGPIGFKLEPVPGAAGNVYTIATLDGKNLYMTMEKQDSGAKISFEKKEDDVTEGGDKEPARKQRWRFVKTGGPRPLLHPEPPYKGTGNKPQD